jgi:hypothetical protein
MAEDFRLGIGGPLHRVERATHLEDLRYQVVAAIGLTWVPMILLALAEWLVRHQTEALLEDLSVHVRLVVTLPLLLLAERLLDRSCERSVTRVFAEGFVPPEQYDRARGVLRSAERWRDSPAPETVLLVLAIAAGVSSLLGILHPAGIMHGVEQSRYGPVRLWYGLVSLPIFLFVLWRSLFRWGLWARVLGGLSRLALRLLPSHADRRGGIAFLKAPSITYGVVLLLGVSCALCAGWGSQIVLYGAKLDTLRPLLVAFALIGIVIAFAPLLVFMPMLSAARRRGLEEFDGLTTDFSRQLQDLWFRGRSRADLLETPSFSGLADLSTTYRDIVERMQVLLFSLRDAITLLVVSVLPALPILFTQLPVREVLQRLLNLFAGGMPK